MKYCIDCKQKGSDCICGLEPGERKELSDGTIVFVCEICREFFESDRSDKEALAETDEYLPPMPGQELTAICEDCFGEQFPDIYKKIERDRQETENLLGSEVIE